MKNYPNAFKEVYTVLSYLNDEDYKKIDAKVLEVINKEQNLEYNFVLDKNIDIQKQNFLPETKAILFNIFRDYLATEKQKDTLKNLLNQNQEKLEKERRNIY